MLADRGTSDVNCDIRLTSTVMSGNAMTNDLTDPSLRQPVMRHCSSWHYSDGGRNTATMAFAALQFAREVEVNLLFFFFT
jgi:hypothetical protein